MRRVLAAATACSLACTSTITFANAVDDTTTEQIGSSRAAAAAFARQAVKEDLSRALDHMFLRLSEYSSALDLPRTYQKFLGEIEAEFKAMKAEDLRRLPVTADGLEKFTVRFGETIRKRFLASWIPAVQESEFRFARDMMKGLVEDARATCATGRSLNSGNFLTAGIKASPTVNHLGVHVSPNYIGLLMGGSPVGVNVDYVNATGGSAQANKDRANFIAVSSTASNVANGFYLNAQAAAVWHAILPSTNLAVAGSGGALGAISNAMVVAAPYLAGVALAAIVAVNLMAKAEAAKLAKRMNTARDRQLRESADYEYVNGVYRETCAPYAAALESVVRVLDDVDGPRRAEVVAHAHAESGALATWAKDGAADDQRQCLINLNTLLEANGCNDLPPNQTLADYQPRPDKKDSFCVKDVKRGSIFALNGKCSIPIDPTERARGLEGWIKDHAAYEATYPYARVMELTSAQVALAFEDHRSLRHRLWAQNVGRLDQMQQGVQLGLERYLVLVKQANEAADHLGPFATARKWRHQFEQLRDDVIARSAEVVEVIFGRRSKSDLIEQLNGVRDRWLVLAGAFPAEPELMNIGRAIDSLLDTVKEL